MSTQTTFKVLNGTSQFVFVNLVQNAGSTAPGDPILNLAYNTANLVCWSKVNGTGTLTQQTLATLANDTAAWATNGFIKVHDTNSPGLYRYDIPNALLTTAGEVNIEFSGAAAGTVGTLEPHSIKLFVGDVMGLLTQQMTEGYPSLNTAPSLSQAQFMQMQRLAPTKRTIVATTETVYKLDGVTVAFTYTLDFAGNPTTFTRAT